MRSGHSSPMLGHINLHPHISQSSTNRRRSSIRVPSPNDSRRQGSNSSDLLIGSDGELHDPSYNDSLKQLRAQIEAGAVNHSNGSTSSLQKRATINSSKSRRGSLVATSTAAHTPPFLSDPFHSYHGSVDGRTAAFDDSSSEEELDEDDTSILSERRPSSSIGYASPFTTTQSSPFTSSLTLPPGSSGTPRRRALTSSSGSKVQRDRRSSGSVGPSYSHSLSRPSFEDTEELVYEAPPLPSKTGKRQGSSLRSSFSAASIAGPSSSSTHRKPSTVDAPIENWQGGFTSLVDVQGGISPHVKPTDLDRSEDATGQSSALASEPMSSAWSRDKAVTAGGSSSRKPSMSPSVHDTASIDSLNNSLGFSPHGERRNDSVASASAKRDGKPRSSSDGSTRGSGSSKLAEMITSTGIALRQKRSESDPIHYQSDRLESGRDEEERSSSRGKNHDGSLFAAGYRPVAELAHTDRMAFHLSPIVSRANEEGIETAIANAQQTFRPGRGDRSTSIRSKSFLSDPLTPLDERGGYRSASSLTGSPEGKSRHDLFPRLPLVNLRRRSSSHKSASSGKVKGNLQEEQEEDGNSDCMRDQSRNRSRRGSLLPSPTQQHHHHQQQQHQGRLPWISTPGPFGGGGGKLSPGKKDLTPSTSYSDEDSYLPSLLPHPHPPPHPRSSSSSSHPSIQSPTIVKISGPNTHTNTSFNFNRIIKDPSSSSSLSHSTSPSPYTTTTTNSSSCSSTTTNPPPPTATTPTATPTATTSATTTTTLQEDMKRRMQKIGLGMRFKVLQAEKKFKSTFSSSSTSTTASTSTSSTTASTSFENFIVVEGRGRDGCGGSGSGSGSGNGIDYTTPPPLPPPPPSSSSSLQSGSSPFLTASSKGMNG